MSDPAPIDETSDKAPPKSTQAATCTCIDKKDKAPAMARRILYVDPLVGAQHRKFTAFTLQMATVAYLESTHILYDTCKDPFEALEMVARTRYDVIFVCDDMQNHLDGVQLAYLVREMSGGCAPILVRIHTDPYGSAMLFSPSEIPPNLFEKELHQPTLRELLDVVKTETSGTPSQEHKKRAPEEVAPGSQLVNSSCCAEPTKRRGVRV